MNVEIGPEAALFPKKEYLNGIFVAVYVTVSPLPAEQINKEQILEKLCQIQKINLTTKTIKKFS
jgi:hypothetical protein